MYYCKAIFFAHLPVIISVSAISLYSLHFKDRKLIIKHQVKLSKTGVVMYRSIMVILFLNTWLQFHLTCNITTKHILNNTKNCDEIMTIHSWRYENKDTLWMLLIFFSRWNKMQSIRISIWQHCNTSVNSVHMKMTLNQKVILYMCTNPFH